MINFSPANIRLWSRIGQCGAFGQAALILPEKNDKVLVISADMSTFSGLERFRSAWPERLFNVGIAEQNLTGMAGGLAREGFIPFATSYASFITMRCADQVKVNLSYMRLPVKLVGLSAGYAFSSFGPTHMSLEDIAIMRALPGVVILSPADCTATVKATLAAAEMDAPVYLRLTGSMNHPIVYKEDFVFEPGQAISLREGSDIAIIATGSMVYNSLKAAEKLEEEGVSASVLDMHSIRPLDLEAIERACEAKLVVTVEEHSVVGGLGGAVAEALALKRVRPPHLIIGTQGPYPHAGEYAALLEYSGLTAPKIASRILETYRELF